MFERIHFVEFFKKFGWDFHEIRKTGVERYILSTGPFVIVSLFATWCNSPVSSFTIKIIDFLVAERLLIMALSTNHKPGQRDSFCSFPGWRVGSIGTKGILPSWALLQRRHGFLVFTEIHQLLIPFLTSEKLMPFGWVVLFLIPQHSINPQWGRLNSGCLITLAFLP